MIFRELLLCLVSVCPSCIREVLEVEVALVRLWYVKFSTRLDVDAAYTYLGVTPVVLGLLKLRWRFRRWYHVIAQVTGWFLKFTWRFFGVILPHGILEVVFRVAKNLNVFAGRGPFLRLV